MVSSQTLTASNISLNANEVKTVTFSVSPSSGLMLLSAMDASNQPLVSASVIYCPTGATAANTSILINYQAGANGKNSFTPKCNVICIRPNMFD